MPTSKVYVEPIQPWEDCPGLSCGRKWGDIHCPYCGYATVRAVPSKNSDATLANGDTILNRVWNCRKCGQYFDTLRRLDCQAPPKRAGRPFKPGHGSDVPEAKPIDLDNMSPEVLAKLEELRKKYQGE